MEKPESKAPILHEEGKDIELGSPFLSLDKEIVEKTFEAEIDIIRDALYEFLNVAHAVGKIKVISDPDMVIEMIKKDFSKRSEKKDVTLALAVIESGLFAIGKEKSALDSKAEEGELKTEDDENQSELLMALEARYSEVEDFLFNHSSVSGVFCSRDEVKHWVSNEKIGIEKGAENERTEELKKIYESKLKSAAPALARFLDDKAVPLDYDIILSLVEEKLDLYRQSVANDLLAIVEKKINAKETDMVKVNLEIIYALRLFSSFLEGERNEKIALRKQ